MIGLSFCFGSFGWLLGDTARAASLFARIGRGRGSRQLLDTFCLHLHLWRLGQNTPGSRAGPPFASAQKG
eukprot:2337614-Pyramimonas_sp.AAC.1